MYKLTIRFRDQIIAGNENVKWNRLPRKIEFVMAFFTVRFRKTVGLQ